MSAAGYVGAHAFMRSEELDMLLNMVKEKFQRRAKTKG
jgi:hypothetical protein